MHPRHRDRPARSPRYIWQSPDWPRFTYDAATLAEPLAQVHRAQGQLASRMAALGLAQREEATLQVLTQEVITTSAIEGENLQLDTVRSSVARKLGLDIGALAPSDRYVDGMVEVVLDATQNFAQALTPERLFGWHAALFPTGYSGRVRISVAQWRTDASDPMEVVSGPIRGDGKQKVHFIAPPAESLPVQTQDFIEWFEAPPAGDAIIKAGLAHLWLVTLHPFDDGNGRISRAVGDMAHGAQSKAANASTASARKSSASEKRITRNSKPPKKARSTSPLGSIGSSAACCAPCKAQTPRSRAF